MVGDYVKKIRDIIIVISIVFCLVVIYIAKQQTKKEYKYQKGFELYVDENFDIYDDLKSGYPIMVDLGSDSCAPCREMKPTLVLLNKELQGKAKIKIIDVVKNKDKTQGFNYRTLPTQVFFDAEGNFYKGHEGILSKHEILKIFEEMGYNFDK